MAESARKTAAKPGRPAAKGGRCPLCGKPRDQAFRPFCSARCRDLDLGKWFDGSYAVPAFEADYDDEDQAEPLTSRTEDDA
jgi:endogenous inhibitor of DNA gyrase (YacG/DUF329 family)